MGKYDDLIRRLEAASTGSDELDRAVAAVLGYSVFDKHPRYTQDGVSAVDKFDDVACVVVRDGVDPADALSPKQVCILGLKALKK